MPFQTSAVLASWAALFVYLELSGRWSEFLAARVAWIVPVAAVLFGVAALGQAAVALWGGRSVVTWSGASLCAAGVLPVLLVMAVPIDPLSSFAADRRSAYSSATFASVAPPKHGESLTFQQLVAASASAETRAALADRAGEAVELVGLVTAPDGEGFLLTRFVVACCVVDATVAQVEVRPAATGPLEENAWVRVSGRLALGSDGVPRLDDASVEAADRPDPPYLYPGG
ncbi:hypothetical protein KVF89_15845 [Nocardioides carbamazepini]|uniref:TIGR03943 family putative permease subunit n=1 Tax=Nocardioides carbamazepini TaxID=2854259 RepID=UPI00214A6EB4|nr:hypothetical protein [Nocardioides carbamazepini]MCR1784012.1 hypothetical protein [Nocardioides carbamazepini]